MMPASNREKLLVIILIGLITLNLAICFFVIFFPNKTLFGIRRLSSFYKIYAVPGPFFKDEFIRSAPHFFISYKTKTGPWTGWNNPEFNNFLAYHQHPWQYDRLKQSVFERFLAKRLAWKIMELPHPPAYAGGLLRRASRTDAKCFDGQAAPTPNASVGKTGELLRGYYNSSEFKELHRYFADLYLPVETDSVSSVYILSSYNPKTNQVKSDTLFHLKYKSF